MHEPMVRIMAVERGLRLPGENGLTGWGNDLAKVQEESAQTFETGWAQTLDGGITFFT